MLAIAYAAAALSGFCLVVSVREWMGLQARRRSMKAAVRRQDEEASSMPPAGFAESAVVRMMRRASGQLAPRWMRRVAKLRLWGIGCKDPARMLARAGLSGAVTVTGLRTTRVRLTLCGAVVGVLMGLPFSGELAVALGIAGSVLGFAAIPLSLRSQAAARNADMERHLSEMVEVVMLGLQSGLSFERSFALYPRYFSTELGRSMTRVASQWEMGLMTREEALHALEAEYDSPLLSRVVRSMVRSLRFGTSITGALEAAAVEARETHRSRMEERVAKVAVKMMLPVGTLILPAMLLLVLGPVMLELVEGF